MTSPFARNVLTAAVASTLLLVICGTYYRHNYILKLHIDNVGVYTYSSQPHMLLELLAVRSGTSRFTSETIHNDLDTFIAMVNWCFIMCFVAVCVFLF